MLPLWGRHPWRASEPRSLAGSAARRPGRSSRRRGCGSAGGRGFPFDARRHHRPYEAEAEGPAARAGEGPGEVAGVRARPPRGAGPTAGTTPYDPCVCQRGGCLVGRCRCPTGIPAELGSVTRSSGARPRDDARRPRPGARRPSGSRACCTGESPGPSSDVAGDPGCHRSRPHRLVDG